MMASSSATSSSADVLVATPSTSSSSSSSASLLTERLARFKWNEQERERKRVEQVEWAQVSGTATDRQVQRDAFVGKFEALKQDVSTRLEQAAQMPSHDLPTHFHDTGALLSRLQALITQYAYALPPYELRQSKITLQQLDSALDEKKHALMPKKKFEFRARQLQLQQQQQLLNKDHNPSTTAAPPTATTATTTTSADPSTGFHGHAHATLIKRDGSVTDKDIWASHLTDCTVFVLDRTRACRLDNIRSSRLYLAPMSGSVHIDYCTDSVIFVACHQLRIHHAERCTFVLWTKSRPIIEHCSELVFSALYRERFDYPQRDEHLNKVGMVASSANEAERVEDFNWLRTQQSPNWRVMSEEEKRALSMVRAPEA